MAHTLSDPHLEIAQKESRPEERYSEDADPEEVRPLLSTSSPRLGASPPPRSRDRYGSPDTSRKLLKVFDVQRHDSSWRRSPVVEGYLHPASWFSPPWSPFKRASKASICRLVLIAMIILLVIVYPLLFLGVIRGTPQGRDSRLPGPFFPPEIQNSWGAYTPYFPVRPYPSPPSHCAIDQVNLIQRHGARFPTSGASARIQLALQRLQSAKEYLDPKLKFLENYTYSLRESELIPFGAQQAVDSGKEAYERYSFLLSQDNLPFVRASLSERVVDSANNWTEGFSFASNHVFNPVLSVLLDENLNDTLDDSMCPNSGSSDEQTSIWTSIYGPPIAARLNSQAPGATLSADDISNLIPLCAFETLAQQAPSPFCDLFSIEEFAQYEYNADLDKYYNTGYGQPLGPVQGVGYVNELLARLTETPVRDNTQTNRTLDSSPVTFPLNRIFYADFSHDNEMIAIYAAMGLFKQQTPLDPTRFDVNDTERTWITSRLTPFNARMVVERLSCDLNGSGGENSAISRLWVRDYREQEKRDRGTFVRILVNDALQPLEFCGGDQDGLCTLDAFVQSQAYARNDGDGDFEKCFS